MKSLKKILVLIVLTFGLLIGSTEIALGQSTILDNDSCICYTDNQDKRATECLKNASSRDSLLTNSLIRIKGFKELSIKNDKIILENQERLSEVTKQLNKANLKLKISKRLTNIGLPIAFCGGAALILLLK